MKTVWKFPIEIVDLQSVEMPANAEILHVGVDPLGQACLWALVDTHDDKAHREIFLTGTGHHLPDGGIIVKHVGTFNWGAFVWHAWEPAV